jgi:hypothetical protein
MRHLFACLLLLPCITLKAQFRCGFETAQEKLQRLDPSYQKDLRKSEENLRQLIAHRINEQNNRTSSGTVVDIPVVVHVIHTGGAVGSSYNPGDAQITGAINYLNAVFDGTWTGSGGSILGAGNLDIRFVLASRDPSNNATTGIVRVNGAGLGNYTFNGVNASGSSGANELAVKNLSRWDPFKYYNIWLVNKIDGCDGITGCPSFIAGYAYFPIVTSGASATTRDLDGTIMLASQMVAGQKTLPHEIGHALNLYHPFEGETNQAGVNGCPTNDPTLGDRCADTNPITNPADDGEASPFSCRTGTGNCYSLTYNDNTERNFMNYTNCYRLFTLDQKARMQASAVGTMRASLATSWANNNATYPISWTVPSTVGTPPVSSLTASNVAGILSVQLNNRSVHSLNSTNDGGYLNNANKWYNLFALQPNTTYTLNVKLLGVNAEQLGVWIDFDNNGVFNTTTEQLYLQTNISAATAANPISISFTTPLTVPTAPVRMRIIEDLSTIYGTAPINVNSTTLTYGQAEDYPVSLQSGGVLPLNLVRFDGKREENKTILNWLTTDEENFRAFVIEAAADGRNFSSIGTVTSRGGTSNQYLFEVNSLPPGTWYFRLKMIDKDDKYAYSKTIRLQWEATTSLTIAGNPFRDQLTVQLPSTDGQALMRLLDMSGREVQAQSYRLAQQNQLVFRIHNKALPAGMYVLQTTVNGQQFVNKVFKQ